MPKKDGHRRQSRMQMPQHSKMRETDRKSFCLWDSQSWELCLPCTSQKHKCIFESTNPYTASTCSSNPKQSLDKACASCKTTITCSCKHPFVRQTRYSLHPCLPDPYWAADRNHKVHLQQGCTILAKIAITLLNGVMAIWLTMNTKILNHTVLVLFCYWCPVEPREWVDWNIIK